MRFSYGVRAALAGWHAQRLPLFYAEIRRGFRALTIHQEERAPEKMEQNPAAQRSVGDSDPGTIRRAERWRAAVLAQHELYKLINVMTDREHQ